MGIRTLSVVVTASALLAGCATPDMSTWSAAEVAAYQQREEAAYQQIMQRANQAPTFQIPAPMQTPQVGPYGQSNDTSAYYCRDLTGTVVACRQVR